MSGIPLKKANSSADPHGMTAPVFLRRRVATRARIVSVSNYWRLSEGRRVVVLTPAGELEDRFLPDTHPALVAFLERSAA